MYVTSVLSVLKVHWLKILTFFLIFVVLLGQIYVTTLIKTQGSMLDADPFSYGAKKYNLPPVTCIVDSERTLYFDQNSSKFIINKKPIFGGDLLWNKD